jgi:hypothetical protein
MLVNQPELPIPIVVQFPFPSWATRASEAATGLAGSGGPAGASGGAGGADAGAAGNGHDPAAVADDPFAGFPG